MDDDLKAYLDAMEERTRASMAAMEERTRADLRAEMAAMEGRLIGRINDVQERMLQGFAAADKRMANTERALDTVVELLRNTNVLLGQVVASLGDLTGRVTRLENKS